MGRDVQLDDRLERWRVAVAVVVWLVLVAIGIGTGDLVVALGGVGALASIS